MKREYPDRPLVGVGAIIIDHGRVLLVKRGHAPLAGEWSIPGGVLELGETLRQAAVREVREETCLTVETADLLGVYDRVLRDPAQRTLYHYVLVDFLCRRVAGEAQAAGDAEQVRWCTLAEAGALSLPEDTAEVIRLGFEKAGR
jgi:mutator protein MutT